VSLSLTATPRITPSLICTITVCQQDFHTISVTILSQIARRTHVAYMFVFVFVFVFARHILSSFFTTRARVRRLRIIFLIDLSAVETEWRVSVESRRCRDRDCVAMEPGVLFRAITHRLITETIFILVRAVVEAAGFDKRRGRPELFSLQSKTPAGMSSRFRCRETPFPSKLAASSPTRYASVSGILLKVADIR
jgi:hypothetical protein